MNFLSKIYFLKVLFFSVIFILPAFSKGSLKNDSINDDEFLLYEQQFSKTSESQDYEDPFESLNRKTFAFNNFVDRYFVEKIAIGYRNFVPNPIRRSARNFLVNLSMPYSAFNSFIQGKPDNGLANISSFIINSTIGIAGLFDVAKNKNIIYDYEDFGQTLGVYGIKSGPYIVLPLLGPSTLRDFSGRIFDTSIDFMGLNYLEIGGSRDSLVTKDTRIASNALFIIDKREELLDVISQTRNESFDFYASMRSFYIQNRKSKILK